METVFDSAVLPAHERAEAFEDAAAQTLVTTRIKVVDPATFGGRMEALLLGPAQLTRLSYGALLSQRTPRMIRQSDPEQYQVGLIRRGGPQGINQARRTARLAPGDLIFYDSSRPFDCYAEAGPWTRSESILLQFPKQLLPLPDSRLAGLLARPLPGTRGAGRLLAGFLTTLADEHGSCSPHDAARLGHVLLDLAAATLAHHLDSDLPSAARTSQDVLYLRITSFVERHLRDRELTPAAVAAAHQISVRHLHRLFQRHGTSVCAYITSRRMDLCRRDLADPRLRRVPIGSIASRWGFPDPSQFTRAFRRCTGMSPSHYRRLTADRPRTWRPA
ncbi:helix-turn-helix domain-containing protein [Streptomyces sp. TRM68416]|uniref:AraC-like ligand-binding domain-containing protein n=1 Tax=Streptomyces sp. TRM68416 TaxID=2758412 RepID=UPI001661C449|nr:helix-turn-helix domain-containing protein [Streptomyces sp. TRM68416]MBD0842138.1 helix-turn-helix domain-containing protein [Streptomyces sp. TRM68416]